MALVLCDMPGDVAGSQGEEPFGRDFISILILIALHFLTLMYSQGMHLFPAGYTTLHTCFKMDKKAIILISIKELHCS